MKQTIVGLLILILLSPSMAFAEGSATLSINASDVSARVGELFDVRISGNANNEAIDTIRAVVTFDPTVVRVQSVRLTGSFDRSAPGNYLDNATGKVSWGAFTLEGPMNGAFDYATVTFLAMKEGSASVNLSADSRMISDGEERVKAAALTGTTLRIDPSRIAEPDSPVISVESLSHLNEADWYPNQTVEIKWTVLEAEKKIKNFLVAFDQTSNTDPKESLSSTTLVKSYKAVKDGIHYFHIKGALEGGGFTPTVHRAVRVDIDAPNDFVVTPADTKVLEGESVWLTFATTDNASGVNQYQMAINDSEFQVQESPLEITDLKAGTYFFRIAALDRAGNAKYAGVSVRVYPAGTDLQRPENYEQSQEAGKVAPLGLTPQTEEVTASKMNLKNLLITVGLVALIAFGIIYLKKFKKP